MDLEKHILTLQEEAKPLDTPPDLRRQWLAKVAAYAEIFLQNLHRSDSQAYVETGGKGDDLLKYPIEEQGRTIEKVLGILAREVDGQGLNPASGGHLAYIPGGGIYPTALGDYLAAIGNKYAGIFFAGYGAVRMENMLIRWMCDLIGFPVTALGNLASGGSIANLIAITTARDSKGIKGRDIENTVIYLTEQAHHSVQKAIRIAGLDEAQLRYVPVDDHFRMDATALQKWLTEDKARGLRPFLVVASAGTTDTGAIDPMEEIATLAQQFGLWFHVDAAYGGFFMLLEEIKPLFRGIEKADSVTIDPHKGLFLAYGLGAVLIKDVQAMYNSHYYKANYMQDVTSVQQEPSPADLSPELTKHFRGLRMWMALQLYGVAPFRAALEEKIMLCRYFHEEIQKLGFETGPAPELSVTIYRYVPESGDADGFNARIVELVRQDGRVFLSSTTIDGVFWIRLAVLCFRTHLDTINLALAILEESVKKVKAERYK